MRPENDIKNPHIWSIMVTSLIPTTILHFVFVKSIMDSFGLIGTIVVMTLPILIIYWILWTFYKKSSDFKNRYLKKK
jgi:hypothetical protein